MTLLGGACGKNSASSFSSCVLQRRKHVWHDTCFATLSVSPKCVSERFGFSQTPETRNEVHQHITYLLRLTTTSVHQTPKLVAVKHDIGFMKHEISIAKTRNCVHQNTILVSPKRNICPTKTRQLSRHNMTCG